VFTCVALAALPVPRVPDFHAINRRGDVVIARRPDDRPARHVTHDPRQHVPVALPFEGLGDVRSHAVGRRDRDEPKLPQTAVTCGLRQRVTVVFGQRLEPNAVTFEHQRFGRDHAGGRYYGVALSTSFSNPSHHGPVLCGLRLDRFGRIVVLRQHHPRRCARVGSSTVTV